MLNDMSLFQMYGAMARHAAETQRVSAENLSRANEPGYKAKQVESFADYVKRNGPALDQVDFNQTFEHTLRQTESSPNGNSVSIEQEVFQSAEAVGKHQMAMTVYTKTLDMMKLALGHRN